MKLRSALTILLGLLLHAFAACQEHFASGSPVHDGRGNVYYASGEPARMSDGHCRYRNAGFGGVAYRGGQAFYPGGQVMRASNGDLFYVNGQLARQGRTRYHQNGTTADDVGGGFYPNGEPAGMLREPFDGGFMAIKASGIAWLVLSLGDGWKLVVNLDSGSWELSHRSAG